MRSWVTQLVVSFSFAACARSTDMSEAARSPMEVKVVTLEAKNVSLTRELPGRTLAYETSEVRPQVSGIIQARRFSEGQVVQKGQALYRIDGRLYRAAVAQARANLASALAARDAARTRAKRYASLSSARVASEQEYMDAKATLAQAAAAVQQARAALDTAQIQLQFTEVQAPIKGRIGRSLVTTGALVTAGQAQPLATITRLDKVFVDLQESSIHVPALQRSLAANREARAKTPVRLKLEDGTDYGSPGELQFAESSVDPNTASVALRASFDNGAGLLLPGMYVRGILEQGEVRSAVLVPQSGVARDVKGNTRVLLVDRDERVVEREVELDRIVEDQWLVTSGVGPGDRVIVEGNEKVKPGQSVSAIALVTMREPPRANHRSGP
jgi:membrane fusion protein (multidrug efflux system)